MADPIFLISKDDPIPSVTLEVGNANRLAIIYIIQPYGNKKMRLDFPVFDETDKNTKPVLFYSEEWDHLTLNIISPESGEVSLTRAQNKTGVYEIEISGIPPDEIKLQFSLTDNGKLQSLAMPEQNSQAATCNIWVRDNRPGPAKWNNISSVEITMVDDVEPSIIKFIPDRIFVGKNQNISVDYEVQNAHSIVMVASPKRNATIADFDKTLFKEQSVGIRSIIGNIDLTLKALRKDNDSDPVEATIGISVIPASGLVDATYNLFNDQKIMGLYNYNDQKLYALICETDENNLPPTNVFLWESPEGMNWTRTTVFNKMQSFISENNINNVPLDFAGSPGVIFNNKLYLIGGSRYDTDFRRNEVYCFDFTSDSGWQKIKSEGPLPTPRMGHSCVVYNNEIWLIGGFTDEGASNEVWTFDGEKWTQNKKSLPGPRCMASAIVWKEEQGKEQIQLYGGFSYLPGFADISLKKTLRFDGSGWDFMSFTEDTIQYNNCSAAVWKSTDGKKTERFLFVQYDSEGIKNKTYRIKMGSPINTTELDIPYSLNDDWYNIQTATFKEVIYQCGLKIDDGSAGDNEALHYFVFLPS